METQVDLSKIKGVESEGINLDKFHKQVTKIDSAEVIQVPSTFTPFVEGSTEQHQMQWVLKVSSVVLETIGEGADAINFRASELFNLVQDSKGNLIGFPKGDKSNLGKFLRDLRINLDTLDNLAELCTILKTKSATIKSYEKEVEIDGRKNTRTYLKFLY